MPALACHGPLLEDEVISSPLARLEAVALHPCLTPTILGVATRVSKMEFDARQNSRMGDAVFAEEAKDMMKDIQASLHERKKKRVHAAAFEAVAAVEAKVKKVLAKAALKARKTMLRATPIPTAVKPKKRNNFGCFV